MELLLFQCFAFKTNGVIFLCSKPIQITVQTINILKNSVSSYIHTLISRAKMTHKIQNYFAYRKYPLGLE